MEGVNFCLTWLKASSPLMSSMSLLSTMFSFFFPCAATFMATANHHKNHQITTFNHDNYRTGNLHETQIEQIALSLLPRHNHPL